MFLVCENDFDLSHYDKFVFFVYNLAGTTYFFLRLAFKYIFCKFSFAALFELLTHLVTLVVLVDTHTWPERLSPARERIVLDDAEMVMYGFDF